MPAPISQTTYYSNGNDRQNNIMVKSLPSATTTVLIAGGGPIGVFMAIKLANCGIHSIVLEKHASRLGQPKAHAVNSRSLEIFRQAGIDTRHLRSLGPSAKDADDVHFVLSMKGLEVGRLPYERQDEAVKQLTPEPLFNIAQPILEDFLYDVARKSTYITIKREVEWKYCKQTANGLIQSTILDRKSQMFQAIDSKYFIGCDGAHARSREVLQIPFETLDGKPPQPVYYAGAHFNADLTKYPTGTLWFILSETKSRILIAYDRSCSWVLVERYDPKVTPPETFTEEYFYRAINEAIGGDTPCKIMSIARWTTTPRTAAFFRSKAISNAFVAGDAAHTFPPTGGLGINTGIADVHNLVWKIHAVESQWCGDAVLDNYGPERQPVALANARQSALNEEKIHCLGEAVFRGAGAMSLQERLDSRTARKEIDDAVTANAEHFNSLNLQLGYIYGDRTDEKLAAGVNVSEYHPKCTTGARLPHGWVISQGKIISTLDLVDEYRFALFTLPSFTEKSELKVGENINVKILIVGKDFSEQTEGQWVKLMGMDARRPAVLVRPDHHIVGRIETMSQIQELVLRSLSAGKF